MTQQGVMRSVNFLFAGLAMIMTVLIGAECVRAGVGHYDVTGSIAEETAPTDLVAAELDPAFVQKLAHRMRAPYARVHPQSSGF